MKSSHNFKISIIIPAHREPDLKSTLADLEKANHFHSVPTKVFIILNDGARDTVETYSYHEQQEIAFKNLQFSFPLEVMYLPHIPAKKAGVGYARKFGMDTAGAERGFDRNHILVCLDGDCRVRSDYLKAWSEVYSCAEIDAAVMQFEHSTHDEHDVLNRAILEYEAHLRYYCHIQYRVGYPHAMQPIGSCLSARADFYQKIGGMNQRKAGEDFYFLQKCQLNGTVAHATNSRVFPSNRISDRVPFGTGRAMSEYLETKEQTSYHYANVPILEKVVTTLSAARTNSADMWSSLPEPTRPFFDAQGLVRHWEETAIHTKSRAAFQERIFRWFHPFRFMKLMHFLREQVHPDIPIETALQMYFQDRQQPHPDSIESALEQLRKWGESDRFWKLWGVDDRE